jgi:hypothetical protein
MINRIDVNLDPSISSNRKWDRLKKTDAKDLKALSNKLGLDGDSIVKNIDLDRDGKLSAAEFQHGIQLVKEALASKLESNKSNDSLSKLKNLVLSSGVDLRQLEAAAKALAGAESAKAKANVDFGQTAIVTLSEKPSAE